VLTLLQTGKRDMVPVVLLDAPGGDYWKHLDGFIRETLLADGMISPEDLSLYLLTDDCQAAVDEVIGFFRVYHSMRYVREKLVLRLNGPIGDELLAGINEQFADIVEQGEITQQAALKEERDEPDLADLPRLVFQFNRRNLGRLRQLIDCLNRGG